VIVFVVMYPPYVLEKFPVLFHSHNYFRQEYFPKQGE
jgi:hypothetical protein